MSNQVATVDAQHGMMAIISKVASDPTIDVTKLSALLDMNERILNKQAEIEFNSAMSRLSGKLAGVEIKRTRGVNYKNKQSGKDEEAFKYASYDDIDRAIRPVLAEEGFSLSFTSEPRAGDGGGAIVTGTLSHQAGHSRKASLPLALDTSGGKNNIQGLGSTISYGKRYTIGMLLNVVTCDDDDGNGGEEEFVSTEQAVEIDLLITEVKADKARFLKFIGADEVQKIKAKDYEKAVTQLNAKKKEQPKK